MINKYSVGVLPRDRNLRHAGLSRVVGLGVDISVSAMQLVGEHCDPVGILLLTTRPLVNVVANNYLFDARRPLHRITFVLSALPGTWGTL